MSLREVHEHEHCAYLASQTPVRLAMSDEAAEEAGLLAVFRKRK